MRKWITALLLSSSVCLLHACYQDVDITLHEPGKYKGAKDALLAKLKTPDWQNKLNERFKLSQTDR
jgi:hypothetical protein